MDDRGKIVVKQHDIGRLTGDTGSGQPHGNADMGLFKGGRVIDAISGDRNPVTVLNEQTDDMHLVLWRHAGKDQIILFELFT